MKDYFFKISFWRIIKGLSVPIFCLLIILILLLAEYYQGKLDTGYIWGSIIIFLIFSLPSLILLINHLYKSYYTELSIDNSTEVLIIKKDSQTFVYQKDQLNKATLVKTVDYPVTRRFTDFWLSFGYLKLEFKDNKVFYLSNLAFDSKKLTDLNIYESDSFFPLILNK